MKKFILSMAGAATLLTSAAILIDYGTRKSKSKSSNPAELAAGIVGAVAGVALSALAEIKTPILKKKKEPLELGDILEEEDLDLLDESISEVLGVSDEQTVKNEILREIELDDEASIDDFI